MDYFYVFFVGFVIGIGFVTIGAFVAISWFEREPGKIEQIKKLKRKITKLEMRVWTLKE